MLAIALLGAGCNYDWSQFGYDAANSRSTPDSAVNLVNARSFTEVWTGPAGGPVTSSPAVATGTVYLGSNDGVLRAFDATGTGCGGDIPACDPRWSAATGGPIASSPAVSAGIVLVGSGDGSLYAFDAAGSSGCAGTPVVCQPLWTAPTGGAIDSSPQIVGGVVYVGSADGALYAFDASGSVGCGGVPKVCAPLWTGPTGGPVSSSPAVSGGTVFVGSDDAHLDAFDAAGSAGCDGVPKVCGPRWTAGTSGPVRSLPAVSSGRVIVGSTDGRLWAFDAAGSQNCAGDPLVCGSVWVDPSAGTGTSSAAVQGGVAFVGTSTGEVRAYDVLGGLGCTPAGTTSRCSPFWSAATGGAVHSSPSLSRGYLYVGSDDGSVHAYRATGSKAPVPPTVPAPHAVVGDREITLRWMPATRVDVPITGYLVHPFRDGVALDPVTVGPDEHSRTFTGLDPAGSYRFTVAVTIAGAIGTESLPSNAERPSAAFRPSGFHVDPGHSGRQADAEVSASPELRWYHDFDDRVSYPVVADGRVFVTVAGDGAGNAGSRLYALDEGDGHVLWGPIQLGGSNSMADPAYEDHRVYTANGDGEVQAFDEATGTAAWPAPYELGAKLSGPPTVRRGVVFVTGAYNGGWMVALDGYTGERLWLVHPGYSIGGPTAGGDVVYMGRLCDDADAYDATSGHYLWG